MSKGRFNNAKILSIIDNCLADQEHPEIDYTCVVSISDSVLQFDSPEDAATFADRLVGAVGGTVETGIHGTHIVRLSPKRRD